MAQTIQALLENLDDPEGASTFLSGGERKSVSFADLRVRAEEIATRLLAAGSKPGDRVTMVIPDQAEFVTLFLGASHAGLVPVPVYPPFVLSELDSYVAHLRRIVAVSESSLVLCGPEVVEILRPAAGGVKVATLEELDPADASPALPKVRPEDMAFLQFTSGSTAAPKGVVVTQQSLLANVNAISEQLDDGRSGEGDCGVSWLPMYHDMGLIGQLMVSLSHQVPAWYLAPLDFVRRPTSWCDLMHEVGGTVSFGPNFAYSLVARRAQDEEIARWDLSRWRVAGCGAEPIHTDSLRLFAERLAPAGFSAEAFMPCYGLAEATLAVSMVPRGGGLRTKVVGSEALRERGLAVEPAAGEEAHEIASCGPPLPEHEVKIVNAAGSELPEGREGKILVRGPSVTAGYFGDPAATAQTFEGGWLHTGDLGFLADGELFVTGRDKDLLIINGRNYHPQDIEWCASEVSGVRRGNVVAFAEEGGDGERLVVVAERRSGGDPEAIEKGVRSRVRATLGLKVHRLTVVEGGQLPKTSSGKLRRAETRAREASGALRRLNEPSSAPSGVVE
ncbi:MAG TPA: AMP-binding protein [Solirubrobacterales bacterium]|nr:AMP-binding protein [Solirubrobacterales bacterium]